MKKPKRRLLRNNYQILRDKVKVLHEVLEDKYGIISELRAEIKTLKESISDLRDLSRIKNLDLSDMSETIGNLKMKVNFYKFCSGMLSGILLIHWFFDAMRGVS